MRRRTITALIVGASLTTWASLPLLGNAATQAELQSKIQKTQSKVQSKKGKEKVLTRDIAGYTDRIDTLETRIDKLASRQGTLEADLKEKRDALISTQDDLRSERARLVRLQKRLREARTTLEARLVAQYKNPRTDLMSVVVEADGFSQLMERGAFLSRLAAKDQQVIKLVGTAKSEATKTEQRLDKLEARQQSVTAAVQSRRDEIAKVKNTVASTQSTVRDARNEKRTALSSVKGERKELEEDLAKMEAASAKIAGQLNGALPGSFKAGSGQLGMPASGTFTSGFGARWGRLHAGIDIAGPIGTPLFAADGGRVAIAGSVSGYGNYTCIQHTAAMSTCYGHQSSIGVRVGQQVTKGQRIGLMGNTGHSTGPHLHFEVRINGTPVNPMGYL